MKPVSPAVAGVLLIVGLIIGGAIGYSYTSSTASQAASSVTTTTVTPAGPTTYTIGTVLPLTGTLASFGVSFLNSIQLAVNQMNANLTAAGNKIQFKVVSADDAGTPQGALSALQSEFQSAGIQAEIGPLTSGEVLGVVQYAEQNHIVILPGAATATSLIGASPYLYRPGQPGDQFEGTVIAESVLQTGGKNVVYIYRDDTSEAGTWKIAGGIMTDAGLKVQGIAYSPNQADYSAQVQTASSEIAQYLLSGGTASNTVVVLGGYGTEAQNIFQHASTDPNLSKVRWYGIEALNDNSLLSSAVGAFMAKVSLTIAAPTTLSSPQFGYFKATYAAVYGQPPEPYSNYFYDNAWIAMLSILAAGANNGQAIINVLPLVANHYYGASSTGIWLRNHDQSIALYDVLKCVQQASTVTFVKIGQYDGGTNQLTLTG